MRVGWGSKPGRSLSWVLKLWDLKEAHIPPKISKNQNVWAFLKKMTAQKASQSLMSTSPFVKHFYISYFTTWWACALFTGRLGLNVCVYLSISAWSEPMFMRKQIIQKNKIDGVEDVLYMFNIFLEYVHFYFFIPLLVLYLNYVYRKDRILRKLSKNFMSKYICFEV